MSVLARMRVLLVDDHTLFRKALASMLAAREDMQVVGDVENGKEAVALAARLEPDLVLMDIHMPGGDGIAAAKAIKKATPQVKVVMLTAYDDDEDLFTAIKSGADGYILKSLHPSQLFLLLDGIRRGEAPISGVMADRILREFRKADQEPCDPAEGHAALTPKEVETLELLVQGRSNRDIANALSVSENTVKRHLVDIMDKLHLQNRIQLAVYAVRQGLADKVELPSHES